MTTDGHLHSLTPEQRESLLTWAVRRAATDLSQYFIFAR